MPLALDVTACSLSLLQPAALKQAGEGAALRARHAEYYRTLVERCAPGLAGAEQTALLERLDADGENVRAALEWWHSHVSGGTGRGDDDPAVRALRLGAQL